MDKLSPTMQAAVDYTKEHGGIYRYPGGFWARKHWQGRNEFYFGTTTIQALVSRGIFEYSEWKENKTGRFPIAVSLVP